MPVREEKDGAGKIGLKRLGSVVAAEDSILREEKIRIVSRKFFPALAIVPRHTLANQKEICMRNGLVIKLRSSMCGGVVFQSDAKFLERIERSVDRQICESQLDVVRMMKFSGQRI